jgi:hypothetical protein
LNWRLTTLQIKPAYKTGNTRVTLTASRLPVDFAKAAYSLDPTNGIALFILAEHSRDKNRRDLRRTRQFMGCCRLPVRQETQTLHSGNRLMSALPYTQGSSHKGEAFFRRPRGKELPTRWRMDQ